MLSLLAWSKVITLIGFYCTITKKLCHLILVCAASFMNDSLIIKIRYRYDPGTKKLQSVLVEISNILQYYNFIIMGGVVKVEI